MSKEIKKPETEVERHGVCDHEIKELREEVEEKDRIISSEYEKVARLLKKNKSLETEVVRLNDIVGEQNRTISRLKESIDLDRSDKMLIKSLRTTIEALRSDAKASQELHGGKLHEVAYLKQCLKHRDAELAEAREGLEPEYKKAFREERKRWEEQLNEKLFKKWDKYAELAKARKELEREPDDPPELVRPPDVAFRTAMEHNHIALRSEVEQLKGEFSKMKQIMFHELAHLGMTVNPDVFEEDS